MNINKIIIIAASIILSFSISSCSSCRKATGENIVKGYITVVGNEPFAKLAIKTDDDKVYILNCDKELEKELYKQQGNYYSVSYKESKIEMEVPVITVEKAIPIEKEKEGN